MELLLVLAVIAVCMTLAIPSFSFLLTHWKKQTCIDNRERLMMMVEADESELTAELLFQYSAEYRLDCPNDGTWAISRKGGRAAIVCSETEAELTGGY